MNMTVAFWIDWCGGGWEEKKRAERRGGEKKTSIGGRQNFGQKSIPIIMHNCDKKCINTVYYTTVYEGVRDLRPFHNN